MSTLGYLYRGMFPAQLSGLVICARRVIRNLMVAEVSKPREPAQRVNVLFEGKYTGFVKKGDRPARLPRARFGL